MSENWKMSDDDVQVPLGVGSDKGDVVPEGDFGEERKSKVSTTVMLLVGVFVAGLALIYLLGLQNRPQSAGAATPSQMQVNSAIEELLSRSGKREELKKLFSDTDQLVQMFYNYPGTSAVDFDQLPANPFEHETPRGLDTAVTLTPAPNNAAELERLKKLGEAFGGLRLQSIMVSRTGNTAMINNKLVRIGGKLGEFVINDIEATRVILSNGKNRFELKLSKLETP